jgi:RNA polymerase-binding transcription factor DksA
VSSRREHLRWQLEHRRRLRLDQIDEFSAEAARAAVTADEVGRRVSRVLAVTAEWALGDINAALNRLDRGTYGICQRCTTPIPVERLEVVPMTRVCENCSRREGRRAMRS